jgi:non-specific serine/threonine protein kinase
MEPQTVERRLTTILSADVVGYSRLMGEDEAGTLAALKAQRSELLDPKAAQYRGRIVKLMGDGTLMEFGSVVDAVSFAVEVQCAMAERNTEVPEARRIVYRIGINIGDVIVEGDDIYGNGVNVAARLEGLAKPGGICISRPVLEQIEGKLEIEFEYTGEHQVKNIERPIHIWRWAKDALLKDRATTAIGGPLLRLPVSHPTNLPRQLSNFVGREREISEIKQHLSRAVFLTLTGAGGCGKTRLSCQVGSQVLQDFPDGVWWVELASLADPALLRQTLATALGIRERPGRTLTDSLSEHLASKSALLILDNCEHLLAACAQLTGDLLRACPRLRILATSREALGVAGEAVYHVPGLSFPEPKETLSPDQVRRFEAVNLFVDRARLRNPEFAVTSRNAATVANVCRRLDGIPLAIELAAARTRVLSVEQIEARLGDRFMLLTGGSRTGLPQHQTLRTTMDWSYQLLSSSEAALLRRLSVFAGRFSLEAAEGVCADELVRAAEILDLLQHLIDKSMVISEDQHGAVRYRLLETVRQYGHERLDEAGECRPAMCHLEFFLALAEEAEPNLQGIGQGASQAEWLDKLALDHDNLRAALEYALAQSDAELAVKLAAALWRFWEVRGYLSEGRESLKQALAIGLSAPPSLQAKALDGAGRLSWRQGDFCDAKRLFAESLVLWRRVEDRAGEANSLHGLARAALNMNDYESARTSCEKSLEIQRTLDDKQGVATAINTLGEVARAQNDFAQAERHYSDSLEIFRAIGDTAASVSVLHNLAYTALNRNDEKKAEEMFRAAMVKARDLKDQLGIFSMLGGLACVATAMGLYERAALLFGAADIVGRAGGYAGDQVDQNEVVRHLTVARSALGAAKFEDAWARGRNMSPAEAVAYALSGQRFGA